MFVLAQCFQFKFAEICSEDCPENAECSLLFCFCFFHSLDFFFPITEQHFYSSFALSAQNTYRKKAKKARMTRVTPAPWCGHDLTHAQYHPGMYQTGMDSCFGVIRARKHEGHTSELAR